MAAAAAAPERASAAAPPGDGEIGGITVPRPTADPAPSDLSPMENGYGATPGEDAAMAAAESAARRTGNAVIVAGLTTETQQIVARPQGGFSYVGNPKPVRTRQHGTWVPVDTTLHTGADGRLTARATAYGTVSFSSGGDGPLVTTAYGTAHYSVSWPQALPVPTVHGDTATYPGVLPDVDLSVRATDTGGFSEVLIVKSAQAARNPRLAAIRLPTTVKSVRPSRTRAADGVALSAGGAATLDTGTALMWDSHTAAGDTSDIAHAGVAARISTVQAVQDGGSLQLTPDHALLSDESTVFPVYIDPTFNWHPTSANKPAFDEVKQGSPCNGASYYNNTGSAGNFGQLGVGYNGWPSGCIGDEHAYYQWSIPHVIWDSSIDTATVEATEVYSATCNTTSTVNLHWTGAINSGTDWNNRPGYVSNGLNVGVSFGPSFNGGNCPDNDSVDKKFNVASAMTKASSGHWSSFTAALAQDSTESAKNRNAFKRFSDNPSLQINYDRKPSTPTASGMSTTIGSDNAECATSTPYPYVGKTIASNTPVLAVKIADPDADKLRVTYTYWLDGSSTKLTGLSGDNLASGSTAKFNLPSTFTGALANGQIVDWQAQVTDGHLTSGLSSVCHFVAEPSAPLQPTVTNTDGHYPNLDQDDPDDPDGTLSHVGAPAGTPGAFAIQGEGTQASKFIWGLDIPPAFVNPPANQTVTATNGAATLTATPLAPGPHTLWVGALDAAGDASSMTAYRFMADHLPTTSCASLAACFNNTAISADSNMAAGGIDGVNSLSATDLTNAGWASAGRVVINGAAVTLPTFGAGQKDNVLAAGQQIAYSYTTPTAGSSSLMFLATSTNPSTADPGSIDGNTTAPYVPAGVAVSGLYCFDGADPAAFCAPKGTVTYSDGTTQSYFLTVPDWSGGPADLAAVTLPHRNNPGGQVAGKLKIYPFAVPLASGKTITSVTLPEVGLGVGTGHQALHIFGMGTRNTTTGTIEANGTTATPATGSSWTGVWSSPTEIDGNYNTNSVAFSNQTFRVALKPSLSGNTMRVKLDDSLGTTKLVIGHATVALDGAAPPNGAPTGTMHNLTFGGSAGTTIPAGGMVYSDPLAFTVTANQWLLVSFTLTNSVPFIPEHSWASDTDATFVSAPGSGDHTTDTTDTAFTTGTGTHAGNFTDILTNLDVTTAGVPTQVVLGDGLIDAWQRNTKPNGQTASRLSDNLAAAEPSTPAPYGTLAEGIESNYVMTDDPQTNPDNNRSVGGPSALSRIDRDVLDQPGVDTVVLDEGLEDVLNGRTSDDLAANGYTELLSYLQANGLDTIVMGLHPCDGYAGGDATKPATDDACTTTVDAERTSVNGWLSGGFPLNMSPFTDPALFFIDTDAAIGVPDATNGETKLDPKAAIATDHVNLTDAGYAALTTAYLGSHDTWALADGDTDPAATYAGDTADNINNPYLAGNPTAAQNPVNLSPAGATWGTDSTRGTVLALDGVSGAADAVGPVLDTGHSYSISAWARLSSNAATATVAAQDGAVTLGYNKMLNAWAFTAITSSGGSTTVSVHGAAPTLNAWTHLVGVYNAGTKILTLYVNGQSVGTPIAFATPWASSGTFELGHAAATGYFSGALSDVQAWDYALTPTQVSALYQQVA
jgi:hypothetical protein